MEGQRSAFDESHGGSIRRAESASISQSDQRCPLFPTKKHEAVTISALSSPFDTEEPSHFTHETRYSSGLSVGSESSLISVQRSWRTKSSFNLRKLDNNGQCSTSSSLNFAHLGLYGREAELEQLQRSFQQVASGAIERQMVLISGFSGTGKSTLANYLKGLAKGYKGLFVRGKFSIKARGDPHSGMSSALAQICGHMVSCQAENLAAFEAVCTGINEILGSELSLLVQVVPALRELIDFVDPEPHTGIESGASSEDSRNRLRFAFQQFVKLVSDQYAPLVFVLDDLQWSDASSLDLIDALISCRKVSNIIIVGIYRSNEVDCTSSFYRTLESLRSKKEEELIELLEIEIGNLNLDDVSNMVGDLLGSGTDERTKQLAEVCLERTQGNPFFLRHFLSLLCERNLLRFNPGLMGSGAVMGWTWDINEVKAETAISENVVDLLKNKMVKIPPTLIAILKVAACLGSSFEEGILKRVLENMSTELSIDKKTLEEGIQILEDDGYIRRTSAFPSTSGFVKMRWIHDKIHESALSLEEDEGEWLAFSSRVGEILASQLDERELDSMIFVTVNLLNQVSEIHQKESAKIAALNYRASQKAVSLSVFESASVYAAYGIKMLPEDCWTDHYKLSLGLFSVGAQAEGYLGNFETMERYCNHVLSIENVPLDDKFIMYEILIYGIKNQGRPLQAAELAFEVLEKFGWRFPKNRLAVIFDNMRNLIRVHTTFLSLDFDGLSELKDPRIYRMQMLTEQLTSCLYMAHDRRLPMVVFRNLNVMIQYGYSDNSSVAFAMTGMLLIGMMGDLKGGAAFGRQSINFMKKFPSPSSLPHAQAMFIINGFVFPWTVPLAQLHKPLLLAYEANLRLGDPDRAFWGIYACMLFRLVTGSDLKKLESDYLFYSTQMKSFGTVDQYFLTKFLRQIVLNLMGKNNGNPIEPLGEVFTADDLEHGKIKALYSANLATYQGILSTYFGDHLRHADVAIGKGVMSTKKAFSSSAGIFYSTYLQSISCFVAASQTNDKKYAKMGEKLRSQVKKWRQKGNPNVIGYEYLLDAESAALKGRVNDAMRHYEAAIRIGSQQEQEDCGRGHLQEAAFACERYGEFHLNVTKNVEEGIRLIQESSDLWKKWGAMGKVIHLESKYGNILPPVPGVILAKKPAATTAAD